ncbi:hypothetical protein NL676_015885 [Syzygium grande]|nr:hypothetical protein NL676_015885 [Syzygium grande]
MLLDQREKEGAIDNLEEPNQALIVKECNRNDDLQEARKGLIEVLEDTCRDSKVNGIVQAKSIEDFDPLTKPHLNRYAFAMASMTSILLGYGQLSLSSDVSDVVKIWKTHPWLSMKF